MNPLNPLIVLLAFVSVTAHAAAPVGYPAGYQRLVDAATQEGKVVIYATTDTRLVSPLIQQFQATYPGIKVEYNDINSTELYNRYLKETTASGGSADVLWSSAMDLQVKLVNDGYALSYRSPEIPYLPDWAHWREEAYGTTFEPIAIVYNKRLVSEKEIPRTHTEFLNLLKKNPKKYQGKVTTYDAEKSGLGFMLVTQDSKLNPGFWDLIEVMGERGVKLQPNTGKMIERISSGEDLIGYNMLGSYALAQARMDSAIGIVLPTDYTLVISRLIFISRTAKNPNAAKLWVDFVLSRRGQTILATQAELYSVRKDVDGETSGTYLSKQLGNAIKPITVGPGLLVYLDQSKRIEFLKQWRQALKRK